MIFGMMFVWDLTFKFSFGFTLKRLQFNIITKINFVVIVVVASCPVAIIA